ncbi:MAG: Na/Pi cotransporter family protein [Proteobacteria bacterium]|nr:Na/Pi cotransporter family protein [Pseudomonadota bacterium]MBU1450241.1 Na/Pi cotransporter family protein [Pseudomonadota bacterium]MBU2467165.1 Na/Pi cotransporter family protein [Pseudomonadota bacterium]MBU2516719.1 Na/Pi cotransporter family protein [Pseudomonadota bacterium]
MKLMSDGLQKVAGDRLRAFLEAVSNKRVVGCLVGTLVTAVIQSSSVTTVTMVGFVNAGLMNLTQAVGVILGANVGTTITAQLIAFKISDIALPAIFIGVGINFFAKRRKWRFVGEIILGFGLLFYGMELMKNGFKPLRTHPEFIAFFTKFDADSLGGILLCVLTGTVLTVLVQSSSATVGITMALASQGLLNLPGSVALILGDNIGTTITAQLACIGSNIHARRVAMAHTIFNMFGVLYIVVLFAPFVEVVSWLTSQVMGTGAAEAMVNGEKPNISRYIANAHTLFNVINCIVFLFLLPLLVKASIKLTFGKEPDVALQDMGRPIHLDYKFVDNPSVALAQAREETVRMGRLAQVMYRDVTEVMFNRKLEHLARWKQSEEALDNLQRAITDFLVQVSQCSITDTESREINSLLRMVNNIERVGDATENLAELTEEMVENKLELAERGIEDYRTMRNKVGRFLEMVVTAAAERNREIMEVAQTMEDEIDFMREEMRDEYLTRLRSGVCTVDPGLVFVDMLTNFEKVGDYCYNIAQAVAGLR